MKKTEIMNNLTRSFHKFGFQIKKHSPEILVTAGVIGTVASTVMACKATLKLNEVLEDTKEQAEKIHGYVEEVGYSDKYTEQDEKKDLTITYVQGGLKVARLYAPAVALGTVSIAMILKSNNILSKRNAALAAAYTTIDKSFKEYRGRVIERFGKELDRELKYNIKSQEITETVVNEDGTESEVKKIVDVVDPNTYSEYARFYDDGCKGWSKDSELNFLFLKQVQGFLNEKLKAQGYLFLNDAYKELGMQMTKAGQIVGWVYDEKNPIGDNFVDFGLTDGNNPETRRFVNGYERVYLVDFNVDGNILDLM